MSRSRVVAASVLDSEGLVGSGRPPLPWGEAGLDPARPRWKTLFATPFPAFRRLDLLAQLACIAAEACDPLRHLPAPLRPETATLLGTRLGCLDADLRFARSLAPGGRLAPALFPYTLPSTCLGELAIRYGLQGPTLCLLGDTPAASALGEALLLLDAEEAAAALVLAGEVLSPASGATIGAAPTRDLCALLLLREPAPSPLPPAQDLLEATQPPALLRAALEAAA